MGVKQWVCHISGQGEKWEVWGDPFDPDDTDWQVKSREGNDCHYLPKSEYRLCDPPGPKWEPIDATYINVQVLDCDGMPVFGQFRMRCSNIEKKVSE